MEHPWVIEIVDFPPGPLAHFTAGHTRAGVTYTSTKMDRPKPKEIMVVALVAKFATSSPGRKRAIVITAEYRSRRTRSKHAIESNHIHNKKQTLSETRGYASFCSGLSSLQTCMHTAQVTTPVGIGSMMPGSRSPNFTARNGFQTTLYCCTAHHAHHCCNVPHSLDYTCTVIVVVDEAYCHREGNSKR